MKNPWHIGITSVNFGRSPEGICTERLVKALLNHGYQITLITSTKASTNFSHPGFTKVVLPHGPREPRLLYKLLARVGNFFENNFYLWSRRAASYRFEHQVPDVFYGRAWPHASLVPAYYLSKHYNKPFIAHFSDPIPPPNEAGAKPRLLADLQLIIDHANALTFTNDETIEYQQNFLQFPRQKAYTLPHVAPAPLWLEKWPKESLDYFYIGSVLEEYPIRLTLEAFAEHLHTHPQARLNFVGAREPLFRRHIEELGLEKAVHILPYTEDIASAMTRAAALVSIEGEVEKPIWTRTKIVEYLATNRRILALTSKNSPTEKHLLKFPESCVVVNTFERDAIRQGFDQLAQLNPERTHFESRLQQVQQFQAPHVVASFERILEAVTPPPPAAQAPATDSPQAPVH